MAGEKVLVLEINEFNTDLLRRSAEKLNLRHLKRVLSFRTGSTMADQEQEHHGLDPWVQWVSVHTETPSQEHGVIRLGDVTKLKHTQIWERIGKEGWTTGVWGVMNASRNEAENNLFFVADPWTFSERPYPLSVSGFLQLPGYFAKNYLAPSKLRLLGSALKTSGYLLASIPFATLVGDGLYLLKSVLRTGVNTAVLFGSYELMSARVFAKFRDAYQPDANIIFLNSIAHFQHHDWESSGHIDATGEFVFRTIDRILSFVLPPEGSNTKILVLNGLSQRNVSDEDFYIYRQIDPARFMQRLGLKAVSVEQCMTNDAHVFFASKSERDHAASVLSTGRIKGQDAFYVEKDKVDDCKLFYQLAFWDEVEMTSPLTIGNQVMPFAEEFALHAKRTGEHVPEGTYFATGFDMPARVPNSHVLRNIWPARAAA